MKIALFNSLVGELKLLIGINNKWINTVNNSQQYTAMTFTKIENPINS